MQGVLVILLLFLNRWADTDTSLHDLIKLLLRKTDEQAKFINETDNKLIMFLLFSVLFNVAPVEKDQHLFVAHDKSSWQVHKPKV